jgi:hypothetical protein
MTDDAGTATRPEGGVRRAVMTVLLVVVLGGLAAYGWAWHEDRSYVGSSQPATLTWTCYNAIFWSDPHTGIMWWAGDSPAASGTIETSNDGQASSVMRVKHAAGVVRFDSRETATFTNDRGATMPLTRQEPDTFYTMECALGPGG